VDRHPAGRELTVSAAAPPVPPPRVKLSPRKRAKISRGVQYAVLLAAIVALALVMDWERIADQMFNPQVAVDLLPKLPRAFLNTVLYTAGAFAVGMSGGTVLALMKMSSVGPYRWIATAYAEFFRGIPALLVVLTVGFAIPIAFGIKIPGIMLKISLALGAVSAAYISETLRAGLQAVPKGQTEAARSLGMSHAAALGAVVVPQAFRIVLPPLTNEFIMLTKDTSLVYLLGLATADFELTKIGGNALNEATGGLTGLFVAGALYLLITLPLGFVVRRLEKHSGAKDS
jgi:polar amino acid transport system permease protein